MRTQWMLVGLLTLSALTGCRRGPFARGRGRGAGAGSAVAAGSVTPTNDDERALYALGLMLAERVSDFNLSPRDLALVQRGMADQTQHRQRLVEPREYAPRLRALAEARQSQVAQAERRRGEEYAAQAAREAGAERLPSGLVFRSLSAGEGPQPTADDEVTVQYRGRLIDGTEFDSSHRHGRPATFQLRGVIPCWTEGVQRMRVGGRARLVCPPDIAYGDRGQRSIPPGSTLDFEVELVSISPRQAPSAEPSAAPGGSAAPSAAPAEGSAAPSH